MEPNQPTPGQPAPGTGQSLAERMSGIIKPAATAATPTVPPAAPAATAQPPAAPNTPPATSPKTTATTGSEVADDVFEKVLAAKSNNRFNKIGDIATFIEANDKLNAEHKALKEKDPYATPRIRQLNEYVAKGGNYETFNRVTGIDLKNLKPEEKVALQMQFENPKTDPAKIERMVALSYKIGEGYSPTDEAVEAARLKLDMDAAKADSFLQNYIEQALHIPEDNSAKEIVAAWTPVFPSIAKDFTKLSFSDEKGNATFDFDVPQSTLDVVTKEVFETLPALGISPDKAGLQEVKDLIRKEILYREFNTIIKTREDQLHLSYVKNKHNPQRLNGTDPAHRVPGQLTGEDLAKRMAGG